MTFFQDYQRTVIRRDFILKLLNFNFFFSKIDAIKIYINFSKIFFNKGFLLSSLLQSQFLTGITPFFEKNDVQTKNTSSSMQGCYFQLKQQYIFNFFSILAFLKKNNNSFFYLLGQNKKKLSFSLNSLNLFLFTSNYPNSVFFETIFADSNNFIEITVNFKTKVSLFFVDHFFKSFNFLLCLYLIHFSVLVI